MNDLDEAELHEKDKDLVHCLCFCNSNTEKIPMWYLYAGITGNGVSFGITPSVMLSFIKSIKSISTVDGKTILRKGIDFDIDWGWVFYRKKEDPSQVMYKRQWYSLNDPDSFTDGNYYIKSYPWEYEKEFRIVIHNKTSMKYKKLVVDITPIYDKIKIKLAPELTKTAFKELLPSVDGFMEFLSTVPKTSELKIQMNLCKRNYNGFLDYIRRDLSKGINNREVSVEDICRIIKDSSLCEE